MPNLHLPTARLIVGDVATRATVMSANFNENGQVAVGLCLREDILNTWQLPQGGWNESETRLRACLRESSEEFGLRENDLYFLAAAPHTVSYPMIKPDEKYQTVQLSTAAFLVRNGAQWNLNSDCGEDPEFSEMKWVGLSEIPDLVAPHKRDAYVEVVRIFQPLADALKFLQQTEPSLAPEKLINRVLKHEAVLLARKAGRLQPLLPRFNGVLSPWPNASLA